MSEKIVQYYTEFADQYDETVLQEKDYIAFEKVPQWIIQAITQKNAHILDLGCGTGLSSRAFFEAGYSVTGIDITPKMIEQCRNLPFEHLHCQSLEDPLPFENAQFDAAVMIGVMEFIQDPMVLFNEIRRVLKDKGLFGITIPKKLSKDLEDKLEIITYDLSKIEHSFKQSGFTIQYSEHFQGFVYKNEIIVQYSGYLLQRVT